MLNVYGNAWSQPAAGQYYRIKVPLRAMNKLGIAKAFIDGPFEDHNQRDACLWNSNIQLHYLTAGKPIHSQCKAITEMKPARNASGRMQYPPLIVFDMDDDIESVNPLNPKYCSLGTRDVQSGELLMPRSDIGIIMNDGDPGPMYLWRHGIQTSHGVFDSGRNIKNHAQVRKMAATAHALTCTSEALAEVGRRWNSNVYVYPNSLMFDDFHHFDIRRRPDEVRVLWQGGYSHFPDFYPLRGAFGESSKRMPQIKWVIFGTLFNCVYENIPAALVEPHNWVDFTQFHLKFGTLAFDINIAPLADTRFNRCKSGIKWYEAAALKIPTLAQDSGPYHDEIVDGDTGLLFKDRDEFVAKLEMLVKDADLRKRIGQRAYEWVHEYRDAEKNVIKLIEFYHKMLSDTWGIDVAA